MIFRMLKHYENKTKYILDSIDKDYISSVLENMPLYQENLSHSFYIIPKDKDILDFTPYEIQNTFVKDNFKGTHFDYHDLLNNLIRIQFILDDDIEHITKLISKTEKKIEFCNDKNVFNLFRNTEEFNCQFEILHFKTGVLNIQNFGYTEIENKLKNITNIWLDDLVEVLINQTHGIIKDDLYNNLKKRGLDDVAIFNVINCLKDSKKILVSKGFLLNKIRISYMQMYYKLYYPKEYYETLLENLDKKYIDDEVFGYSIEDIKNRYYELNERCHLALTLEEDEELELLKILIEMYERNIKYSINGKKIIIKQICYEARGNK